MAAQTVQLCVRIRIIVLALTLASVDSTAGASDAMVAGGEIWFQGQSSVTSLIELPRSTPLVPDSSGGGALRFRFDGEPGVRGAVLRAETPLPDGRRPMIITHGSALEGGDSEITDAQLPAGRYRLYLLTAGQAASIRLKFPYGEGSRRFDGDPVTFMAGSGFEAHPLTAATTSFRAASRLPVSGVALGAALATIPSGGAAWSEWCWATGQDVTQEASYARGCGGGGSPRTGGTGYGEIIETAAAEVGAGEPVGYGGTLDHLNWQPAVVGGLLLVGYEPPASTSPEPAIQPPAAGGGDGDLVVARRALRLRRGRVRITIRCEGQGACDAGVGFQAARAVRVRIADGEQDTVTLRLSAAARRMLRRRPRVRQWLIIAQRVQGVERVTRLRVTLRR